MGPQQRVEIELDTVTDRVRSLRLFENNHLIAEPSAPAGGAGRALLDIAQSYPGAVLCWFDRRAADRLSSIDTWGGLLNHRLEVRFFPGPPDDGLRLTSLGYAGHYSSFLLPMRGQSSSAGMFISPIAGVCYAELLAAFGGARASMRLSRVLADIGRLSMQYGACAYADARLFIPQADAAGMQRVLDPKWREVADLVAGTYGRRALSLWLLGLLFSSARLPLLSALAAMRRRDELAVDEARLYALRDMVPECETSPQVEAVIPTLERPEYLLRILGDLAVQATPPARVHVVAQGEGSVSAEVERSAWPFELSISQVSWVGACRARNFGIDQTRAEWVLLVDDDVRLPPNYVDAMLALAMRFEVDAVNALPAGTPVVGVPQHMPAWTWRLFLSGLALCRRRALLAAGGFQERMEGVIYEDFELGVRLRLAGSHVIVTREMEVVCDGAPTGGFRSDKIARDGPVNQPGFAVYLCLADSMTRPMRRGFHLQYFFGLLGSRRWWQWPAECVRYLTVWRSAHRWYQSQRVGHGGETDAEKM